MVIRFVLIENWFEGLIIVGGITRIHTRLITNCSRTHRVFSGYIIETAAYRDLMLTYN